MNRYLSAINCDYLVVGAGAASMAFIDTILTELSSTTKSNSSNSTTSTTTSSQQHPTIVLVDRKQRPGGHWLDAYGHIQLHQPSVVYGVSSKQLEGNWAKLMFVNRMLPWKHRANKTEILNYYDTFVREAVETGRLMYLPECDYDFDQVPVPVPEGDDDDGEIHTIVQKGLTNGENGKKESFLKVKVRTKLVNGVLGECKIPSQCPVQFPVDDGVTLVTPNNIFDDYNNINHNDEYERQKSSMFFGWGRRRRSPNNKKVNAITATTTITGENKKHYIVLGCGKTAMDTVIFLQNKMKIHPEDISWVIPNDVWMIARDQGHPGSLADAMMENDGDQDLALSSLEQKGVIVRMDTSIQPTKFRFPVIGADEIQTMRRVTNLIRRGRVTGITTKQQSSSSLKAVMEFGQGQHSEWVSPVPLEDCVFIHCTSPGPFNGLEHHDNMFFSEKRLDLLMMFPPPVTMSMSCIAFLEAARNKGTLNISLAKKLSDACCGDGKYHDDDNDDAGFGNSIDESDARIVNDILNPLIKSMPLVNANVNTKDDGGEKLSAFAYQNYINYAVFLAIADKKGPMVGYKWMKENRLCMLSIPGSKCRVYETMCTMASKGKSKLGLSDDLVAMVRVLRDELEPLKGM